MNLFVRNIAFAAKEQELKRLFEEFGEVSSCKIIRDRDSKKSKGFGFVEMQVEADALDAIENLNDFDLLGRKLSVSKAKPKEK